MPEVTPTPHATPLHLSAGGTSLVVDLGDARLPRILHWGEPLGETDAAELVALALAAQPAIGDSPVTYPEPVPVLAQLGEGWLGRPGLVGDRATDGGGRQCSVPGRVELVDDPERAAAARARGRRGIQTRTATRAAGAAPQRARAAARALRNGSGMPFRVQRLELALPVPETADEVLDFAGRWSLERVPQRRTFEVGEWVRASRGGKPGLEPPCCSSPAHADSDSARAASGRRTSPGAATRCSSPSAPRGLAAAARRRGAAARRGRAGERRGVHDAWLYGSWGDGLDALAARFHRHLRGPAAPPAPRARSCSTPGRRCTSTTTSASWRAGRVAAAIGVERFVARRRLVRGRRDDTGRARRLVRRHRVWPDGLRPLVERVHGARHGVRPVVRARDGQPRLRPRPRAPRVALRRRPRRPARRRGTSTCSTSATPRPTSTCSSGCRALVAELRHRLHQVGPQPCSASTPAHAPAADPASTRRPTRRTG